MKTNIEWAEHVWNPVRGCSRISPGCLHCYAERDAARKNANPKLPSYRGFAIFNERREPMWTSKVELLPEMLEIPLRRRKPTVYFVNSMSDLFHESLPEEAIDRVFAVMALCPQHTFLVLTKRAERMREYLTAGTCGLDARRRVQDLLQPSGSTRHYEEAMRLYEGWPLPNCWLGVSVENDEYRWRIDHLVQTPAAVRFVSAEPLLGALDLTDCLRDGIPTKEQLAGPLALHYMRHGSPRLDWVIIGGESGPGARPFDLAWPRQILADCKAVKVPVFLKQLGTNPREGSFRYALEIDPYKGGNPMDWPRDLRVRAYPSL